MKKQEFLRELKKRLSRLPRKDVEERINFYNEVIDDRMEEGLSEDEAVSAVGSIDKIAEQIISDRVEDKVCEGKAAKRKPKVWALVLLIAGAPIWLPILLAVFVVIWSVVITLWAIELPFFIFEYISKFLIIVCKPVTVFCCRITEKTFIAVKDMFR